MQTVTSIPASDSDPTVDSSEVQIYAKSVGGVIQLFVMDSDGTVINLSQAALDDVLAQAVTISTWFY